MARNLGHLTAYGLESIYDFIGEEKVAAKIEEYRNKPTMGYKLEDYIGSYYDYSLSLGSDKGPLHVMMLFYESWFKNDIKLALFLFDISKCYSEENYIESDPFKSLWDKHLISSLNRIELLGGDSHISREDFLKQNINPYWPEYHFFSQTISSVLIKYKSDEFVSNTLNVLYTNYLKNSDRLTERMKLGEFTWSVNGLGSSIYSEMEQYYFEKNDKVILKEIWEKANSQGWNVAFYYEEEFDEEF